MAAGVAGVVRAAARLENSACVFACWSLTFSATGPAGMLSAVVPVCDKVGKTYRWLHSGSKGGWQPRWQQQKLL